MKFFKRLIVLLIVYRLAAASTFGIVTWYYKINLLDNPDLQLYGGIAAGILSLLTGLLLVIVKKKKKPAKTLPNETGKKIETASVITPGTDNGLMVDEIPQQPDLPAMPEYEPYEEEAVTEEYEQPDDTEVEINEPETVNKEEFITETVEEEVSAEGIPEEEAEPEMEMIPEEEAMETQSAEADVTVEAPETEEMQEELPQTGNDDAAVAEEKPEEPEKVKKIFVDDTTQIISTASLNDYLKKIRENRDIEVTNANAIKNDIILPLGPREAVVEEEEIPADEVVVEEEVTETPVTEMQPMPQEEMVLKPLEEEDEKTTTLSRTQENYITQSTLSYIDESGKPQFRVTEEIKTVSEPDESQRKGFEGFDVKAERAERWANFLNGIITILIMAIVLILLYYLYNKFFA